MLRVFGVARHLDHSRLPDRRREQTAGRAALCGNRSDLLAQHAQQEAAHLYADVASLITEIDIELEDGIRRLRSGRVPHPCGHLTGAWRNDLQRLQRKRQPRIMELFEWAVDQSNGRLNRAIQHARMKNVIVRRFLDRGWKPEQSERLPAPAIEGGERLKTGAIDETHSGECRVDDPRIERALFHLRSEVREIERGGRQWSAQDGATLAVDDFLIPAPAVAL